MEEKLQKKSRSAITVWLLIMLLGPAIFSFLPDTMDMPLNGVVLYEKPVWSMEALWNGSLQRDLESYASDNLGLRGIIIRVGNQFRYSVFHVSTHELECLGKNGQIYELPYVYRKTQIVPPVSQEYIEERILQLEAIQQALEDRGTHLFIFITPSKAEIYPEDIPDVYMLCAPEQKESSYELLLRGLEQSSIPYYDSVPFVLNQKEQGEKVYALTGTHWTQATGAKVSAQLVKELENSFGYDLTEYTVKSIPTEQYIDPDADIFNLLNILQKPYDDYYAPQIEITKTGASRPNILCRGGSFMGQSILYLFANNVVGDIIHIENTRIYSEQYSKVLEFSDYEEIDVDAMLKDKDILLLEVNQESVGEMSFGFIDYLYEQYVMRRE